MVPVFLLPQEFAAEEQELPYPDGSAGVVAVQTPLQLMVPEALAPQALAAEVQALP